MKKTKNVVHHRTKYVDPSQRFLDWVHSTGFHKTFLAQTLGALDSRFNLKQLLFIWLFCFSLSSLIFSEIDFTYNVRVGQIAVTDIKSPVNLEFTDDVATENKRIEAEKLVSPVFDYDANAYEKLYSRIYSSFLKLRREIHNKSWPMQPIALEEAVKDFMIFQSQFEKELGQSIPAQTFEWLIEKKFSARIENILIRILAQNANRRLVDGIKKYLGNHNEVIVRSFRRGLQGDEFILGKDELTDINQKELEFSSPIRGIESLSVRDKSFVLSLAQNLIQPNLTYNLAETQDRKQKARKEVLPVQQRIQKGQILVSEGQVIQDSHLNVINAIEEVNSPQNNLFVSFAASFLFLTLILVCLSYVKKNSLNRVKVEAKDLLAMGSVTLAVAIIAKIFIILSSQTSIAKLGGGLIPQSAFLFLTPVAMGPILVGLLISTGEIVWLFTIFLATVLGIMMEMNFSFVLITIVAGIASGRGLQTCKQRHDIYRTGLRVGLINSLSILLFTLVQRNESHELLQNLFWNLPAGFLSGIFSSIMAIGLIPLLETVFNYTTDIKLLELASLNHPLMKDMIVKAPGTYHHCLIVGSMCEAAAEGIGANPLLAKVMAYYHDIGKIEHAQYFIENQRPGQNPHNHLTPHMSKTVLIAHVKDGAELGLRYRLGKPILDGILQHHGTTLISYFYNRALKEQDQSLHQVNEADFRYPGPKPQFREAALVMLADSIEAAARSLESPTVWRLQNIVKTVIQNKFLDGQLEECNLTLKELTVIEASFKRVLLGAYHQRIDLSQKNSLPIKEELKLTPSPKDTVKNLSSDSTFRSEIKGPKK